LRITLVQAVSKGDRMDLSLQKAAELGVYAVQPLFSERTEVRLGGDRMERRVDHWQRVLISACEQCGRARVPLVLEPVGLEEWLAVEDTQHCVVLEPTAERPLAAHVLQGDELAVVVGPEGGFSERELKLFQLAGVQALSLGPRVLRTETAGPVALAVLQALHGDLGSR
jgi:16S rRNA (uracil1498-N3)-methyltransferase